VGPTAGLDAVVKRKIPSPYREMNPNRPSRSQTLYRLSYLGSTSVNIRSKKGKGVLGSGGIAPLIL
jgi:hypothetical protein